MLNSISSRVTSVIRSKSGTQLKEGVTAVWQQAISPAAKEISVQTADNNAVTKYLSTIIVNVIKSFRQNVAPVIERNKSFVRTQGEKAKEAIETNILGEVSARATKMVSDFKGFRNKKSFIKNMSRNTETETIAEGSKTNSIFDEFIEKIQQYTRNSNAKPNKTNLQKVQRKTKTAVPGTKKYKSKNIRSAVQKRKSAGTSTGIIKTKRSFNPESIPERIQKAGSSVKKVKSETNIRIKKSQKQPTISRQERTVAQTHTEAQNIQKTTVQKAEKVIQSATSAKPKAEKIFSEATYAASSEKVLPSSVQGFRGDIKILEEQVQAAEKSNQNTNLLRQNLFQGKKNPVGILKSEEKGQVNLSKKSKVKTPKRYKRLTSRNFVGKTFGTITGKGGAGVKEQYSPDGKLLRTLYNKGNGLIEIKEAATNKIYYMRDGMIIEKYALEEQNKNMQRLIHAINSSAGSGETQKYILSYAKNCGMKRVNQTIILDGKATTIVYKGFGYDITADGRVLAKNYTSGNQVFRTAVTGTTK